MSKNDRVPARSGKRRPPREDGAFSSGTVKSIWDRDAGKCAWCGALCIGERGMNWAVHHRRPRSMGGTSESYVARTSNGVLLHTECHATVESDREYAALHGFLVSALGIARPKDVPIMHAVHGRVRLDDDGTWAVAS